MTSIPWRSGSSLLMVLCLILPEGARGNDVAAPPSPLPLVQAQEEASGALAPQAQDSITILPGVRDSVTVDTPQTPDTLTAEPQAQDSVTVLPEGEESLSLPEGEEVTSPESGQGDALAEVPVPRTFGKIPVYRPVLFSALLPGTGQLVRDQKRGIAYLAAEAAALTAWAFFRNEGNNNEDEYIEFARENARETAANFDPYWNPIEDRIHPELEGDWDYYEHMSQYRRSGRYDRDLNTDYYTTRNIRDLDPETEWDDSFNYRQWGISRINYFHPDPENPDPNALVGTSADTIAAKEYYARIAVTEAYAWDWGPPEYGGTANRNQFARIIDDANSAFRNANFSLGVLLANHVVSAIDAYISVKTYNSKIGGAEGLGLSMSSRLLSRGTPRSSIGLVRRF